MSRKESNLIVKDNALINASYNLDLSEQRLILLAIVEGRRKGADISSELTIHADSYIKNFGVKRNAAYESLKSACNSLFERRFSYQKLTIKGNIEHVRSRWVQRISYVDNEALVRIIFSEDIIPLISSLERRFTSYELEQVSALTSAYAMRLYELLIAWQNSGRKTPIIELADFRYKLGIEPHEYTRMTNFKSRVLDTAIKQINQHTNITATYKQHKAGRSIRGFSFSYNLKNENKIKQGSKNRQVITKNEAAQKAHPGEEWAQLTKRLSRHYVVRD